MKSHEELHEGARLTAYALGELEGAERRAVEARLAGDPQGMAFVEEVRDTARMLQRGLAAEGAPALEGAQREAIERAASAGSPRRRAWPARRRAAAGALAAALLGALGTGAFLALRSGSAEVEEDHTFAYMLFGEQPAVGAPARRVEADRPTVMRGMLESLGYVWSEPHDAVHGEAYARIDESAFIRTADDPRSTFSIDVDTASYSNVRRFLRQGQLPPADAVRIEELVNYFPYDYAGPTDEHPFAVHVEVAQAPWQPRHHLVRIGLAGKPIPAHERRPANLVFLIDVSGSMSGPLRLPLVQQSLAMLVNELRDEDSVALVVYAGAAGVVLPSTPASSKTSILDALERLEAGGSTAGGAGIELAYKVARESFVEGGINRVILATDGDFNVGIRDEAGLTRLIEQQAKSGVFLTVLGYGMGNLQDSRLEQLSGRGNGHYAYIDSLLEARKVLVHELGATLETIAQDVKIQLEFNPSQVGAHRLIGYENRLLAHRDFTDDAKDAGEIGAGHTVTALYELVPLGLPLEGLTGAPASGELRYQGEPALRARAFGDELLHVALRYKQPGGEVSRELGLPVRTAGASFFEAGLDTRFAASVAAFGLLLRGSEHVGSTTLGDVVRWASEALGEDPGGYRAEFLDLVRMARELRGEER